MASSAAHKHLFYTELAKLLDAGFGVREAARAMRRSGAPRQQEDWLRQMETGIDQGKSIAESFGRNEADDGLERSILEAGERSGRMAPAFHHLADYFGMMASVRASALSAMIYPFFLLHLGVLAGIFPTGLMHGEKISTMLGTAAATLLGIYALLTLIFFGGRALLKTASQRADVDALLNAVPLVGKARRNLAMARFTKVYHACVLAGISMTETARTATKAAQSGMILLAGTKLEQALKEGNALGPVFVACRAFPGAFARSYMTAEESGTLDQDLRRWASVFQEDAERATRTLASVVPKILYALIVAYVVWQIARFYAGYLDDLNSIGVDD